jgi:hypothetical protein
MCLAPARPILLRHVPRKHTCLGGARQDTTGDLVRRLTCFSFLGVLELPPVGVRGAGLVGAPDVEFGCGGDCESCARLRSALLDALDGHELESLAAEDLSTRAGLPMTALATHYGTIDNCVVAAFDELSEELYRCQVEAFAGLGDWHMRFSNAVVAVLQLIESRPGAAQLCFAEIARRHPGIRAGRAVARQRLIRLLADEHEREHGYRLPDLHFEFLVGALYRAAQDEVAAGRGPTRVAERLRELLALLEPVAA